MLSTLPTLEHEHSLSVGRAAVLETGPLPLQDHKSGTVCRPISDYVGCHMASSGCYWRHSLFGQWGHGAVWTVLTAPYRNILTYLLTYLLTLVVSTVVKPMPVDNTHCCSLFIAPELRIFFHITKTSCLNALTNLRNFCYRWLKISKIGELIGLSLTYFQGDHFSGKPRNVREIDSCQGNVTDFNKSQQNVGEKILEKLPKTVYCKLDICIHTGI